MDTSGNKELEEMIEALEKQEPVRRAGKVSNRGEISISDNPGINDKISGAGETNSESESNSGIINISINHVMEYYIYAYYFKPEYEVVCSDKPFGSYFRQYGDLCMQKGRFRAAEAAYKDAICWNPVDLDSILGLAECYKHLNMMDRYLIVTKQAYRYCCTRATMARYYRNMGYYCTSKYNTDVARACYIYSNIYYRTENADNELAYLENALKDKTPEMDIATMQKVFDENGIEPGPNPDTIGIIYRVGELMMQDGEYRLARDCFSIVYDITREKELEELLDELEKI